MTSSYTTSDRVRRDGGQLPNGELILGNILRLKKSYSQVVEECSRIPLDDPVFQNKYPEVQQESLLNFQITQLSDLIQEKRSDRDGSKIKVLSFYFGYDSHEALLREKTFLYKLSDAEHNAKLLIADWLHFNWETACTLARDRCLLDYVKELVAKDALANLDPRLPKCNLGPASIQRVFRSLENSGFVVRRGGRYVTAIVTISDMIRNLHDRYFQLQRCVERPYHELFGSELQRRDLARLLKSPLEELSESTKPERFIEADADCQVALTAGHSSFYQHVLIELPPCKAALSFLFSNRKNNPSGLYPDGFQYDNFHQWFMQFKRTQVSAWSAIHWSLKQADNTAAVVLGHLQSLIDNVITELMAVEHSMARPLGKARENTRYEGLKPMNKE